MSELDENKALVRRHLEEAVSLGRPEVRVDIMAEDFMLHHPLVEPGRASYAAATVGALRPVRTRPGGGHASLTTHDG